MCCPTCWRRRCDRSAFPKAMHWDAYLEDGKGRSAVRPSDPLDSLSLRRPRRAVHDSAHRAGRVVGGAGSRVGGGHLRPPLSDDERPGRARGEGAHVRRLHGAARRTLRHSRPAGAPGSHRARPRSEGAQPRRPRRQRGDAALDAARGSAGSHRVPDGDGRHVLEGVSVACRKKC